MATLTDLLYKKDMVTGGEGGGEGEIEEREKVSSGFYYRLKTDPRDSVRFFETRSVRFKITEASFPYIEKPITHGENSWSVHKEKQKDASEKDLIEMRSILNKLTKTNLDKFIGLLSTREPKINYDDTKITSMVFEKIISEHSNTAVYIAFCKKFYDMDCFSEICFNYFKINNNQIIFCPLIAHLYYNKIINIDDVKDYINLIAIEVQVDPKDDDNLYTKGEDGLSDKSCLIIASILKNILDITPSNNPEKDRIIVPFSKDIQILYVNRQYRNARCRCLLMDLHDKYNKIASKKLR